MPSTPTGNRRQTGPRRDRRSASRRDRRSASRRGLLRGLAGAALVGTAGCLGLEESPFSAGTDANADWPMARHDPANAAFAPDAAAPRTGVAERWAEDVGFDVRAPAVVDGTVYAPAAEGLVALDAESGEERWRFAPTEQPWPSPPVVHDGVAYVTMVDDDTLHAVDAESGEERWRLAGSGHVHASPHLLAGQLVDDPAILVGGHDGVVRALGPGGDERWSVDAFGSVRAMAYDGRGLYVGTGGGEVYAYFPEEEAPPRELWRRKVGPQVEGIVPTANGVFVSTFGGPLTNLQDGAHAGTTRWVAEEAHAGSPPVHAGSWVYSAGWDSLSALRTYDKNLHWRVGGEFGNVGPVAAGDTLYVAGEGAIHAFDLDGGLGGGGFTVDAKRWSQPIESGGIQGLAVGAGALFVACEGQEAGDPSLFCLEPA